MKPLALLALLCLLSPAQTPPPATAPLTVDFIMRGPALYGHAPRNPRWSGDSKLLFFEWKRHDDPPTTDFDTYAVNRDATSLRKLSPEEALAAPPATGHESEDRRLITFARDGDIFLHDRRTDSTRRLMRTSEAEISPRLSPSGSHVTFIRSSNLYSIDLATGFIEQLTDIRPAGSPPAEPKKGAANQEALKREERALLEYVDERARRREEAEAKKKKDDPRKPWILQGRQQVVSLELSPAGGVVLAAVREPATDAKQASVPFFVTESGYTEPQPVRPKAGDPQTRTRLALLNVQSGELKWIEHGLAPKDPAGKESARDIQLFQPRFSRDGKLAVIARSADNKDRWILLVDTATAQAKPLDHLHDDAWIGGPGAFRLGWLPDSSAVWFQSERDGWSHLYSVNVSTLETRQLTSGPWEVEEAGLTPDRKRFLLLTSESSLHERHYYEMQLDGGPRTRITREPGMFESAAIAPDGSSLALIHSYTNRPPELFITSARPNSPLRRVTTSPAPDFSTRQWLDVPITEIPARDGAKIPAHIYKPSGFKPGGPAVIFVHGAGYLQNVHRGWSNYARERLFHHLLNERGYLVIDIDYRASAGYGRNWRTAIYRHMGGADLNDHIDAARWLVSEHAVNPARIGIYGGSYGGFITLMAMFTQPGVFAAGAALRPVTDWAHYNHPYTTNILNAPQSDAEAYKRSSPIYHAAGLKGALLICHGMVDVNVHFQDTVRLAQKLIELRKENWEVALYPVEDHSFQQATSWADEYKRILKLFESNLNARTRSSAEPMP